MAEARDFGVRPYTADEERVARFLSERGVGGGDDPVGFLLASYAFVVDERNALRGTGSAGGVPGGQTLFLMSSDGRRSFVSIRKAGAMLDSWFSKVEIGGLALEPDMSVRDVTEAEVARMNEISDEISDSK